MSKSKGKGGKNRRRGKKQGDGEKRELEFKDEDQEYAQVSKVGRVAWRALFSSFSPLAALGGPHAAWRGAGCHSRVTGQMLGNGRLEATCFDGTVRLCHIRGKFRKRYVVGGSEGLLAGVRVGLGLRA